MHLSPLYTSGGEGLGVRFPCAFNPSSVKIKLQSILQTWLRITGLAMPYCF